MGIRDSSNAIYKDLGFFEELFQRRLATRAKKDSEVTIESVKEEMQVLLRNMENLRKENKALLKANQSLGEKTKSLDEKCQTLAKEYKAVSYTHLDVYKRQPPQPCTIFLAL